MAELNDDLGIRLMKAVMIEAHMAAMQALMEARSKNVIPAATNAAVEAAFKFAVHNNLITVNDPRDWPSILERVPDGV